MRRNPADGRDGDTSGSVPPPSSWLPPGPDGAPADEWTVTPVDAPASADSAADANGSAEAGVRSNVSPDRSTPPTGEALAPSAVPPEPARWLPRDTPATESPRTGGAGWSPATADPSARDGSTPPDHRDPVGEAEPLPAAIGEAEPVSSEPSVSPGWAGPEGQARGQLLDVPAPLTGTPRMPWDTVAPAPAPELTPDEGRADFVDLTDGPPADPQSGLEPQAGGVPGPAGSPAAANGPAAEPTAAGPTAPGPTASEPPPQWMAEPASGPGEPVEVEPPRVKSGLPGVQVATADVREPTPAAGEPDPAPGAKPHSAPASVPGTVPAPTVSEPTSTPRVTVPESTITTQPQPDYATANQTSAKPTEQAASIIAEHPEYLIAGALVAGFLLAKVVKRLAH